MEHHLTRTPALFQLTQFPIRISSAALWLPPRSFPDFGAVAFLFLKPIELIAVANRIRDGVAAIDNNGRRRIG